MSVSNAKREFRGADSILAEDLTRDAIAPFLNSRGYIVIDDERHKTGTAVQQFISVRAPDGQVMKMRVRLCWRRGGRKPSENQYSAAQLAVRPRPGGWDATFEYLAERDRLHDVTHNLILQRDGDAIIYAALIPVKDLGPIWNRQREVSNELLRTGRVGRMKKNHAENGSSPTIWLQDDRSPDAHLVADVLWQWPSVIDLAEIQPQPQAPAAAISVDDTYDDCPAPDYSALGRDGAERVEVTRSLVRRDPRVRHAVLKRATACERAGCGEKRNFPGFLDVHHILGVEKSDRVYNCVALCPNCHREAHFAPNAKELNAELLAYAMQYQDDVV
ncbi:HNH endonuclease [Pseudomonas aeruginosa]|nr:HNH endonuclease [Pseudomonas aeruginosa]NTT53413.1 HNH endonuclease [Pseudomonas aeruginosa]